jgi:outer membrane protein
VKAESRVRISAGNLNANMGLPPETPILIQKEQEDFAAPYSIDLADTMIVAINERPETNAALHRIQALCHRIQEAKAAYGPKITTHGLYGKIDDVFVPKDPGWYVGVCLEVPLFEGFETKHQVAKAEAELRREQAEYDRLVIAVKQDVWNAYSRLLEAYESIQVAVARVDDANESLRLISERYKAGSSIVTDLLDADTAYVSSQANLVDAHWKYRSAFRYFYWSQGK